MTELRSNPRLALCSLALLTLSILPPAASALAGPQQEVAQERGSDDLAQVLLDARRGGWTSERLASRLAGCMQPRVPRLFGVLERGRFDVRIGERGNSTRALTPLERGAIVLAFGELELEEVRRFLRERRREEPGSARRLAALSLLGALGTSEDLPALLSWSTPDTEDARVPTTLRAAFGRAFGALLDRRPRALGSVSETYMGAPVALLPSILKALGERPSAECLSTLAQLLRGVPAADPLVMAEIGQVASCLPHPIDAGTRHRVRGNLQRTESTLLVETIMAVGKLGDSEAVADLIELLEHRSPNVRAQAHTVLGAITGQVLAPRKGSWRGWHTKIQTWWREEAPQQLREVAQGTPAQASRAIMELSRRRLYRHELAEALARGLHREEESLVVLTCAALGALGSSLAVPELRALLEHPSTEIKRAAYLSLLRITGEDHGESARSWLQAGW